MQNFAHHVDCTVLNRRASSWARKALYKATLQVYDHFMHAQSSTLRGQLVYCAECAIGLPVSHCYRCDSVAEVFQSLYGFERA